MYVYCTVAAVYAVAISMYNERYLRYMLFRNEFILYGSCGICYCEMYLYCTVDAVYAVAKFIYTVRLLRYKFLRI